MKIYLSLMKKTYCVIFQCRTIWLGEENARFIGVMGFIDKEELFDDETISKYFKG